MAVVEMEVMEVVVVMVVVVVVVVAAGRGRRGEQREAAVRVVVAEGVRRKVSFRIGQERRSSVVGDGSRRQRYDNIMKEVGEDQQGWFGKAWWR
ncbi:hypothetical protein E2C01_062145 [Portunus trituberculatus]|uniref:Uncharacterized protein n=1 Tax=Portunus trituberculatus TaxID=210409 RepID=A0A5B7HGB0_PORTR|nr:hypothetical protein [Portunus trituberculatus]